MEHQGYAVETSGPAASLSRLEGGDIDLVLLDLGWPEADGLDLCLRLRRVPTAAHIPIVALTDFSEETREVLAYGCCPDEYLSKPFTPKQLFGVVARYANPGRALLKSGLV